MIANAAVLRKCKNHIHPEFKENMYALNVLSLWLKQKINFRTVVHAFKNRPTAVAGRGGYYIVDPTFE